MPLRYSKLDPQMCRYRCPRHGIRWSKGGLLKRWGRKGTGPISHRMDPIGFGAALPIYTNKRALSSLSSQSPSSLILCHLLLPTFSFFPAGLLFWLVPSAQHRDQLPIPFRRYPRLRALVRCAIRRAWLSIAMGPLSALSDWVPTGIMITYYQEPMDDLVDTYFPDDMKLHENPSCHHS